MYPKLNPGFDYLFRDSTAKSQVHIYNNAVHYFVLFIVQISVQNFFLQNFLCNSCAATQLAACVVIIFNVLSMCLFSCTCAKLYFYTGCPIWNPTKVNWFVFGAQTLFSFRFMFEMNVPISLFLE